MEEIRGRFPWLSPEGTTLERPSIGRVRWWTFGGLRANATLADHLQAAGCSVLSRDNLCLTLDASSGVPPLQSLLPSAAEARDLLPPSLAEDALESLKFAFCTPRDLCLRSLRRRLADPRGAAATAEAPVEVVS
jgi:ATP-dependent Lhr-like helicase